MARSSNRELILDTFAAMVLQDGVGNVSLEAVAEQAGVSKGGLLYHFPSRSDLLQAFGERLLERVDAAIADAPTDDPAAIIQWYIGFDMSDVHEQLLWLSLMTAMQATNEGIGAMITAIFERYAGALTVLEPELREHVRLVGDGMFLNVIVGMPSPDPKHTQAIIDGLIARI